MLLEYKIIDITSASSVDPHLPPNDISATPISPCMASITWTTPPTSRTAATADTYIFEIQLMENGIVEQWVPLGRSPSPPLQVHIPSRGLNTFYNLRGHGYNSSVGNGTFSVMYGPFVSYPDNDIPMVSVAGYAAGPDSIRVSWSVEISTCFMFKATLISCGTLVASEDEEMSGLVTGLQPDTEYTCSVHGVWSESSQLLDTPDPWISEAIVVTGRANTHSRGAYVVVSRIISKLRLWLHA